MLRCCFVVVGLVALAACEAPNAEPDPVAKTSPASAKPRATSPPRIVELPEGTVDLRAAITRESAAAASADETLVVYVGAKWCEPCERFKAAVARGELDHELAGVRFLVTDLERDGAQLEAASCSSKMIPLFARAEADGTCSPTRRTEGGIKGEGAVGFMLPRVKAILAN
ncbi:MAG TPA: hypothetical protein VL400_01520 [Polyangiaceae bacterium]|jgi:hypothetical protein|nr:hypothetical protein [Polyangiaceae bacterium]